MTAFHSDLSDGQKLTEKSPNVFKIHLLHNMAVVEILSLNREGNIEGCIMNDANDEQEAVAQILRDASCH